MKKNTIRTVLFICLCIFFTACQTKTLTMESVTSQIAESTTEIGESEQETTAEIGESEQETTSEIAEVDKKETVSENTTEIAYTVFEEKKTMYAINPVNVRCGPNTDFKIVSYLNSQEKVEVTGQADNGWFQIMVEGKQAYISNRYLSDKMIEPKEAENVQQKKKTQSATGGIIMVGDSRCVQMQNAVSGGGCAWVCENSKGYDWFCDTAMPRIDAAVTNGTKIVINLGVNDPGNVKKYAETVNTKAAEWSQKGATVYFVSVNPVWENPYTTEEQVTTFNSTIPSLLSPGIGWIDTHSWLITNGYRLVDGIHYDDPTYINIYNVIMGSI